MSKKGFTLVELMVVIVIIGVLAAVAIPRMMAATNKAKASEGPQILGSISRMQAAYKAEQDTFLLITARTPTAAPATATITTATWGALGFDQDPYSQYFTFAVPTASATAFNADARLHKALGRAAIGQSIVINEIDVRTGSAELRALVPNWK